MDTHPLSTHLLLVILSISAVYSEEDIETQFCLGHQKAFEGSCYEFVTLQRSFLEAQSWCERGGGHLAFIQNDETQQFLQGHLQTEQDWWLGLAPSSFNFSMGSAAIEGKWFCLEYICARFYAVCNGSLSWLDGSDVSYSNWLREPELGEACGYILKQSGFQWASTKNCSQELHFICEFESGHALACLEYNATIQCGSGQVIEIDDSFYGRKTPHYCRVAHSLPDASLQEECSWVDVVDQVSGHCHGLQVCQAIADVASFGEPCPGIGSYLSVDYHCKDGLHLLINKQAAIFHNVTLAIKWLLHPFQGNLTCTLNAGDGHTIDPYMPEELQSIIVHRYQHAGVYTVTVECSTSEWHVTAQKTITIQEPIGDFRKIVCHSSNQTTDRENCKGLNNHVLRIQVQLSAGTNITYKIQNGITELVRSSEVRGIVPHNITIPQKALQMLGLGCHQLTLLASNGVTAPDVSVPLELCLMEPVNGLQASVAPEQDLCSDSAVYVNVSLDHGAPVEVLFLVSGDNNNFSETHHMLNGSLQTFRVSSKTGGSMQTGELSGNILKITANPESPVVGTSSIMLDVNGLNGNAKLYTFAWNCSGTCPCNVSSQTKTHQINATCLPPLYSFSVYFVTAIKTTGQPEVQTASKCISVSPGNELNPVITCSNCNPVNVNANVKLQLQCEGCQQIVWYFEDTNPIPVNDVSIGPSVEDLQDFVSKQVDQLLQHGKLTGSTLAQMFQSVSYRLNEDTPEGQEQDAKMKLREKMLLDLGTAVNTAPLRNPGEVQKTADAVVSLTTQSEELTSTAQLEASSILSNLSMSLVSLTLTEGDDNEVTRQVVTPIIQAASNILKVSASTDQQEIISENVLNAANNVQSALLAGARIDQEPIIVSTSEISVYVNRMSPVALQKQSFSIEHNSSASFVLPSLGPNVLPLDEPVDLRMLSFAINPFPLREGEHISGAVASLSITREDGSVIPVSGLSEEIEIILPRPEAEVNSTFLDLGNYSTLIINVTTPNISLVLKLDPSEEIPLHLLLGFEHYPNNTHYKASIQLPQPGHSTEERYAWVLDSRDITLEVGVYYLLVRPIGSAGVNSSNASVYIMSIAAQCKYWNETETTWSDYGCRVGPHTTPLFTQCFCTHLTFFGSSFFVMPNLVDVSRTAELFATFVNNPVVVCFVGAIFLIYLIVVVWARRKDIQDTAKVKVTVLEDNDPLAEYRYLLTVTTGHRRGASTSSQVTVTLLGSEGESEPHHLTDPDKPVFERGGTDMFLLTTPFSLGELQSIRLWHDNSGKHPACNLFFMKTTKDFQDSHIWFSVINRPPNSNFTRVQRVSCCCSLLLCTMLTSIMFWGIPTDPSEQTMDLGKIEFTWQQVMIGIQSSIIMFPINLLIVSIFRNVRPRERRTDQTPKHSKTDSVKQGKTGRVSPTQPPSPQSDHREITPDAVTKDIKRIAQSLSKALRSPMPRIDPEEMDINALLSLVEDIICQQNRAGEFYSDTSKKELAISLGAVNLHERSPDKIPNEKHSIFRQYLYKQLQNLEKELRLLGPSRFSKPESYIQAVLQVQGMKRLLEPYLSSSSNRDQASCSSSLAEDHGGDKKCCQKGLPWWFVFVGWILVAATSGVSAYFTMMYGLTYGTDRSINWLISMVVSFFESLFITQPIKVLGFAVFFALVLKRVDQEEYGDVPIEGALSSTDDPDGICIARRDSTCNFYQPPPPCDIEKMRNSMIKEQKVFALIREILIYVGFLWMLLLVAYGQRDPNAYYLTQHIQQNFRTGIADSMTYKDVFTWANTTFLNNVFGQQTGFITDGNSKLVGNARLRQVRVHKDSCKTSSFMRRSILDCHAPYSWEVEDMGSYGPGWNRSTHVNVSKSLLMPWRYQTQSRLRAHPIWGGVAFYRGGGFVVDLGPNKQNARSLLQYLFENIWVDKYTRAIFVEFTVYNANVNLFCIVTLMFETTAVGAFQYRSDQQSIRLYQSTDGFHIFMMASEVIYFLFILYYMFQQGKLMKQQKWEYFRSKWNLLELAIIILSWSALCVFIKRTLLGKRDIEYYQKHKDEHASFHETATADGVLGYLVAFLVLLATVKLWHLLRLNPKMQMITATLRRAWNDISGFIIVMTIMFLAYSIACNLMYGWKLYSYHTLLHAAKTIISLQLGIFNYEEVLHYNPVLGAFVIGSCIIFMTFVVLNLFISVILVAFSEEQIHHK
ncbi:hypothetical protein QTP70_024018, partial [Hemibagrus guttatus]